MSARRISVLVLPAGARATISRHVRAAWPREGCGLLSGRRMPDGILRVTAAHATDNVAPRDRPDRFEVDPAARIALSRSLRGGPDRVIGHFHSHPGHPPVPSETDRHMGFEPDLVWLIVGLSGSDDSTPTLAAWAVATEPATADGAALFEAVPIRVTTEV